MTKAEALSVFVTAMMREVLREEMVEEPSPKRGRRRKEVVEQVEEVPQPRFDFEDTGGLCEHEGSYYHRATCPVHGNHQVPSIEELDLLVGDEGESTLVRAQRQSQEREARRARQRLFPEDLPMSGMGPPDEV